MEWVALALYNTFLWYSHAAALDLVLAPAANCVNGATDFVEHKYFSMSEIARMK